MPNTPSRFSENCRARSSPMPGTCCRLRSSPVSTKCVTRSAAVCATNYRSVRFASITDGILIGIREKISAHSISVSDSHFNRAVEMKDRQDNLGDVPPEIFREQLHQLADWIADYREKIETLRVAPNAKPGAVRAALPAQPPEEGEAFDKIFDDIKRVIVPGMVNWAHPMFLGYFGWTTTAPGILGEIITSQLNVKAMTWRT